MVFDFFGSRYRPGAPSTNGGGGPSSRFAPGPNAREAALQRELDSLLAERAALSRRERDAAKNLARMQDALDVLAGEIDRRAMASRDSDLRERGEKTIAAVKDFWNRQDDCSKTMPETVTDLIKNVLGLEPWPKHLAGLRAPQAAASTAAARTAAASTASLQAAAQAIVDAGARARGERVAPDVATGIVRRLRSELPPVGSTARAMIDADRKRRGMPPYGDDE
jgi:hypothetical protein